MKTNILENARIEVDGQQVPTTHELKYLGVTLDRKLTFKTHINNTRKNAFAAKRIISPYLEKTTPLSQKTKKQLYKAYVKLILLYASPVWSSASENNLQRLQVVENAVYDKYWEKQEEKYRTRNSI